MSLIYDTAVIGIRRAIENYGKDTKFFIYPFGERGGLVKGVLNAIYGVEEVGIADNYLCNKFANIMSLNELKEKFYSTKNAKVLIAHTDQKTYSEVRENLFAKIERTECVEVFESHSNIEAEATRKLQSEASSDYIYPSHKTKSIFYLPDCKTDFVQGWMYVTDNYFQSEQLDAVFNEFQGGILKEKAVGKTFLDVGANVGSHTFFFFNELKAGRVYSFEPIKHTFEILKRNVTLNHAEDNVQLYNCGCGDSELYCDRRPVNIWSRHNFGSVGLDLEVQGDIKVIRLDDLDLKDKVFFMKIDVEGMELNVLHGACGLIERDHPYILVEAWGDSVVPIKEYLQKFGYSSLKVSMCDYLCY